MEDFNSGYPGEKLEDLLKDYANGQLVTKDYVSNAIADAITTTLNTPV